MSAPIEMTDLSKSFLRGIFGIIGKSTIRKISPIADFYFSVLTRTELLQAHQSRIRKLEDNVHKSKKYDSDYLSRHTFIAQHLEFCRETLARLDIKNTIDHVFKKPSKTDDCELDELDLYYQDWQHYMEKYPNFVIDAYLGKPHKPVIQDTVTKYLVNMTYKTRRGEYLQRLKSEVELRHKQGWFFVFDTITLAPEHVKGFYDDENAIRNYTRNIGRKINHALGRGAKDSYHDVYKYFLVPEFGDEKGRLHFHCLHLCKVLPLGTVDPASSINLRGEFQRHRRELQSFKGIWNHGFTSPISVRYKNDAYTTRLNWLTPLDKDKKSPLKLRPVDAVISYIAKYVSKNIDSKSRIKNERSSQKWQMTLSTKHQDKQFRVRMSRGFGMDLAPMSHLSIRALKDLCNLHWKVSPLNVLLKKNARKELMLRMANVTLHELTQALPAQTNMLFVLRNLTKMTSTYNPVSFTLLTAPKLDNTAISNETKQYLWDNDYFRVSRSRFGETFGAK